MALRYLCSHDLLSRIILGVSHCDIKMIRQNAHGLKIDKDTHPYSKMLRFLLKIQTFRHSHIDLCTCFATKNWAVIFEFSCL